MIVADQAEVLSFLARPDAYPGAGTAVERIDTHAAAVFLAGERAYKLKRAVRYDYLDYSTVDLRKSACEREIEVNRGMAPALYLGAEPVMRRSDGQLAIGGAGEPVDWLVVMRRFDQDDLLDHMAERGRLDVSPMIALAGRVADLHERAEVTPNFGGRAGMAAIVDGNAEAFSGFANILPATRTDAVTELCRRALDAHGALLDSRRDAGYVRRCHGDLHLRNIVMRDEGPTPFDAIEFNDAIACGDVFYDAAFLMMDLWHRQMPAHANAFLNGYLVETGDDGGLPLLPLFLGCRAAIRAKTTASAVAMNPGQPGEALRQEAVAYLELVVALLDPVRPALVAVGGRSGSGKSTLAARIAPRLGRPVGSVIARSDIVRKALFRQSPELQLGPEGYTPEVSQAVYDRLAHRAARVLAGGQAVVIDAVFLDEAERLRVQDVAHEAGVSFVGIWIDAPEPVLVTRVAARVGDASDATPAIVRKQQARGSDPAAWVRIDGSGSAEDTEQRAVTRLSALIGQSVRVS